MNTVLDEGPEWKDISVFDEKYENALLFPILYQAFLLMMSALILDGGQCLQYMLVSMSAFWLSLISLIISRRLDPSNFDILYIKWGFFAILACVPYILAFAWWIRGV